MGISSVVTGGAVLLLVGAALVAGPPEPPAPSASPGADPFVDRTLVATSQAGDAVVVYDWPTGGPTAVLRGFEGPAAPWMSGHRGVDLEHDDGAPVRAAGDGVVAFAGTVVDRGVVSIDHDDGLRTTYEPVAAAVARGDRVGRGEVVGHLAGVSHCAPDSCLHWGARRGSDSYLDPMSLLREDSVIRLLPLGGG